MCGEPIGSVLVYGLIGPYPYMYHQLMHNCEGLVHVLETSRPRWATDYH